MNESNERAPRASGAGSEDGKGDRVLVIGSGFGGAVTACRLSQAGFDVHILERGRRYGPNDFPALPTASMLLPDLGRWTWKDNQGLWDILDLEEIISVQGAGYGGGSLIYANVQLRPPDVVFDDRWPKAYRQGAALKDFYPLGSYMLDAAPITEHAIFADVIKADQLKKTMDGLGRTSAFFYPPIAVNHVAKRSIGGRAQKACTGCGACCSGCPETAKNTLDYNYLALAERHGAHVRTQCEVTDIESVNTDNPRGRDGWHVHYVDHMAGRKVCMRAKHVFLCAGSIHSTRLLARAKLPSVKRRVGVGYFPGGDALGVVYKTANAQYPSFGPTITTTTVHWEPPIPATPTTPESFQYFLLQDGGYAKELERAVGLLRASAWVGRNRLSASTEAAVTPASPGSALAAGQRATPNAIAIPSFVDDVAKAVAAGNFHAAIPHQLLGHWPDFLKKDLAPPLLIEGIVTSVINGSMQAFLERNRITKLFKPEGLVWRAFKWVERRLVRFFFGTDEELADRALKSALAAANLPRDRWVAQVLGYEAEDATKRVMLLAMGRDAARGTLLYHRETDHLVADLDLFHLAPGYSNEERLMTDVANQLGGELRTNPAWAFLGKPITVHNQGGCPMSDKAEDGVTTPEGRVHGCEGLYVLDGSIFCTSVGVNPSATITAIAERNILQFIREQRQNPVWPANDPSAGAQEYDAQWQASRSWGQGYTMSPPDATQAPPVKLVAQPLGVEFEEALQGYYAPTTTILGDDADDEYLIFETRGRPDHPVNLRLTLRVEDLSAFFEDETHAMTASGSVRLRLPGTPAPATCPVVSGRAEILAPRFKPYGLRKAKTKAAYARLAGRYTTVPIASQSRPNPQRLFYYLLCFDDAAGGHWTLYGYKRIRDNPAIDAWRDASTLFVTLFEGHLTLAQVLEEEARRKRERRRKRRHDRPHDQERVHEHELDHENATALVCRGAGAVHVELTDFLFKQLPMLEIKGTKDPARITWGITSFATFFFGSILRIYSPAVGTAVSALLGKHRDNVVTEPHRPPWRRWRR